MFDLSLVGLVMTTSAMLVGGVLQGVTGYGYAVLVLPLLAAFNATSAPQVLALAGAPFVCTMALMELGALDLVATSLIALGRIGGTIVGLWLLKQLDRHQILALFAAVIVIAAVLMRVRRSTIPHRPQVRLAAGLASGIMGTAAGVGGPALAVLYAGHEGAASRATVSAVYGLGTVLSIVGFAGAGRIHASDLATAAILSAALMSGLWVSRRGIHYVDARAMRRAVQAVMWLSASALLAELLLSK